MPIDEFNNLSIDDLLDSPVGKLAQRAIETVSLVQRALYAISESEDSTLFSLLKIGTVFQLFLINTLLGGKKPEELSEDDWRGIASQVAEYAVFKDGQSYSVFVFNTYADYIETSANVLLKAKAPEDKVKEIKAIASELRVNAELLESGELTEIKYTEECLWSSLEGMIKCLSLLPTLVVGAEFGQLIQATAQLTFEYGRYALYSKEKALLTAYIENQYKLDEKLQQEYEEYLAEVNEQAKKFQSLIDAAFTPEFHESLLESVALARATGVKEEELLTTIDEIDDFFM